MNEYQWNNENVQKKTSSGKTLLHNDNIAHRVFLEHLNTCRLWWCEYTPKAVDSEDLPWDN